MPRKEVSSSRAFALPLLGIVALLAFYALLADWQNLHRVVDPALTAVHWSN